jgi:lysophospholipase L1-like esterase
MKLRNFIVSAAMIVVFATLASSAQSTPVTIFLAGDSTMAMKHADKRPETGWGEMLGRHFKDGKVRIDNRAANGRSTKSFIAEGKWQALVDSVKKGDYVLIQFGHNDESKDKGERYAPPEEYKKNLARFAADLRAKGGNPVLLTPVMRRRFDNEGKFYDTHGEYPDLVRTVAKDEKVPLIDMHKLSEGVIVKYGVEDSKKLFLQLKPGENANYPKGVEDNTHFSPLGAEEMAKLAVTGIRVSKIGLRKYLK